MTGTIDTVVPELADPTNVAAHLAAAADLARAAAVETADGEDAQVGDAVALRAEDVPDAATHYFAADKPGYRGWYWAVTVAGPEGDVNVSEVVLLPGPESVVAPAWVPWTDRLRAEDLGPGDLLPVEDDDERLVPAHAALDPDSEEGAEAAETGPGVREVGDELGMGRPRVMSREGRLDAAVRWSDGDFGPGADMARSASAHCGTCGFYLPVAGSLRAAFGVCGNGNVPADGHVVHAEYGCGGHSELQVDSGSLVAVADLVYDDGVEMEPEPAGSHG
ncbi:hypothetical protein Acsp06_17620 [Actinomycetospora sp. NBRC 106375]|uniref:DUF3027 domain-containing protein n=1 Tax=Actinomycetospora sp. NBRC 106375 TaxID=3032207 RepID=UPI0024A3CDC0|nr:DUF3027 domain-containing protein [Actinomycetospora sp. NBRC 106375]GLZ45577.1 hypothetical protein Acsp06_17620 [Actinomycetospora sp. NBRC 106375]